MSKVIGMNTHKNKQSPTLPGRAKTEPASLKRGETPEVGESGGVRGILAVIGELVAYNALVLMFIPVVKALNWLVKKRGDKNG